MKVIEYIKNLGLEQLQKAKGIKVREYDDRIVLNYHQIDSPKFDKVTRECRGLILSKPDLKILCRSFDRFFNYGEGSTPKKIKNFQDYIAYEKMDGSLIHFYHDGFGWCVSSRGMAFAEGTTNYSGDLTFRDIVDRVVMDQTGQTIDELCESWDPKNTYIFELTSLETRVVKPYNKSKLTILNIRDRETGEEYGTETVLREMSELYGFNHPIIYEFKTIEDCIEAGKELPAFDEGYVLYNPKTNHRLKVKNPAYLAIAHLRGDGVLSEKRIIRLVFMQDYEEYLTMFPEDRKFFDPFIEAYNKLIAETNSVWEKSKDIADQKDFAMQVKDTKVKTLMFQMRKGHSISAVIEKLTDNSKELIIKQLLNNNKKDK